MEKSTSEHVIQSSYLRWLALQHPKVYELTASIPNGGKRDLRYAMRLKSEGMKKGFPDLITFWPSGNYHGLVIEFKSKKGYLREEQRHILGKLSEKGYCCLVARSFEEAKNALDEYLNPKT